MRIAVGLLWASLMVSIIDGAIGLFPFETGNREFFVITLCVLATVFAMWAFLIHFTSKGRNWARVSLLAVTTIGWFVYVFFSGDPFEGAWWSLVATVVILALDATALTMLFSGRGARWYEPIQP